MHRSSRWLGTSAEDASFRSRCVEAFGELAGDEARPELEAFAALDAEIDRQEDMKGAALRALYPRQWTWAELERFVTPSRHEWYLGLYQIFLLELPDRIRLEEVPAALRYLSRFRDPTDLLPLVRERLLARAMETLTTEEGLRRRNIVTAVADALRHTVTPLQIPGDEGEPDDTSLGDPESERRCREVWQGSDPARHAVLRRLIESCSETDPSRLRASTARQRFVSVACPNGTSAISCASRTKLEVATNGCSCSTCSIVGSKVTTTGQPPTWTSCGRLPTGTQACRTPGIPSVAGSRLTVHACSRVQRERSRKERLKQQRTGFPEDTLKRPPRSCLQDSRGRSQRFVPRD